MQAMLKHSGLSWLCRVCHHLSSQGLHDRSTAAVAMQHLSEHSLHSLATITVVHDTLLILATALSNQSSPVQCITPIKCHPV